MDRSAAPTILLLHLVAAATGSLDLGPSPQLPSFGKAMNDGLRALSAASADAAWRASLGGPGAAGARQEAAQLAEARSTWRRGWCEALGAWEQAFGAGPGAIGPSRMVYLLCRGPRYTEEEVRNLSSTLGSLQDIYSTARVCTASHPRRCYRGEPDLERLVRSSRDPKTLLWAWQGWREAVGPPAMRLYPTLVELQNAGARRNGYADAGEVWRESDFEREDLESKMADLFEQVAPLYRMLHAVVRARLIQLYGEGTHGLRRRGPIPAHLLGNLWGQNWEGLLEVVLGKEAVSLDTGASLRARNVSVEGMVRLAEDLYASLGLPRMTSTFWKKSIFRPANPNTSCHGSAANMFTHGDFRMILCAEVSAEDFYVIHHEMGHIEYYMAYEHQPAIFQDGASPAFQEAVGDAISLAATTPQHLQRIGLIDEWKMGSMDIALLLKLALAKLAQLPYSLVVDKWRWSVFRGEVRPNEYNRAWWAMRRRYQGVDAAPLSTKHGDFFDPATKFHIADNTPYARYFLSGILQMQIFRALCDAAVSSGHIFRGGRVPPSPPMHRCDIYGSKEAGRLLREVMSSGSSLPWPFAMRALTGDRDYDASALLHFFQPLKRWMQKVIEREDIPVGWD
ncbi:angiotensin-converting enzyme-like [Ischnura elegans]|uniref:angiotensin-converting enzyme-like n=1 Tax=Ischnura elegans TaxID=197161 RepID=UPI001ED8B019|nr:angiotensin-converting enzyme-like [Ischnura elegans]